MSDRRMSDPSKKIFEFGRFRLDTEERVLLREGQPVPLTLKAFDLLLLLVENSGHIVEKDELMNRVWAGSFVEEGNLKVTVSMLRKALEDNQLENRLIETVPLSLSPIVGQKTGLNKIVFGAVFKRGAAAPLIDLPAAARKAVKGEANCFIVRGVHRSEARRAETLDGLRSAGYSARD